jgi:type II secretory ATPase GspE/PulE/Tfp pilus assembly ATPase PilB-like protein
MRWQVGRITDWIFSLPSISSTDSASEPQFKAEQGDAEAQSPVIRIVNLIISEAVDQGASHIHVEPTKTALQIRHRVDGLLRKTMDLPKWVRETVISRVKIMANLDIVEKRLPQDGRIAVRVGGSSLDLLVSTVPTIYGESLVIQILDSANATIPKERA